MPRSSDPIRQPSRTRRRVALACGNCRERKVRCDGGRPICGACQRRGSGQQCEYLVVADTAKYQMERAYLQSLRDHVADLQGSIQQPDIGPEMQSDILQNGMNQSRQDMPFREPRHLSAPVEEHGNGRGDLYLQHREAGTQDAMSNPTMSSISAMGAAVTEMDDSEMCDQFYGQSSIVSLIQECTQTSTHRSRRRRAQPTTPSTISSSPFAASRVTAGPSSWLSDDFSLPPRRVADWLLEIYFTSFHIFYPWVHKQSFMTVYQSLWSDQDNHQILADLPDIGIGGRSCPTTVFHCALNAMFALACEFSPMAPEEKRTSSFMFYERMKSLINIDILDCGSLSHVQALLLVGKYLQCTPFPKRCWNVVGMAYRMSVGLGLHLSRCSNKPAALEKEMRWRIWCACVQMDIIVSMTMGRPAMTAPPCTVPLPSTTDDEYLSMGEQGVEQPMGTVSGNQFFYENMRLIGILGSILITIYRSTEAGPAADSLHTPAVNFQAVMDIDYALEKFESSIHPALHWNPSRTGNRDADLVFRRQSNVLHARFLHLRLLLYRPAFSTYCSTSKYRTDRNGRPMEASGFSPTRSWSTLCLANCAEACIQSACDLIKSLERATIQDATGAWWYGVFYLVSAGIILILADLNGVFFDKLNKTQLEAAWSRCLQTLHRMVDVHPSARDYAIALSGLKQRPPLESHGNQAASTSPSSTQGRNGDHECTRAPFTPLDTSNNEESSGALYDALSPLLSNWDSGLEDIMLPAQLLREMDEGLSLPNIF